MIAKRKVRCFKALAHVGPKTYNYPVYYLAQEGWSDFSLVTCSSCGEIFIIDWSNPDTKGLSINDVASSELCPICNSDLRATLRDYPKSIRLPNGELGSYIPDSFIPPDNESLIAEFYEIIP